MKLLLFYRNFGFLVCKMESVILYLASRWLSDKESACGCRFDLWVRKIPWRRKWQPTTVVLPGKSHGQRSLVGYSPRDCKELNMCKQLST